MKTIFVIMKKELHRWSAMHIFYTLFALLLFAVGIYTWFFNIGDTTLNSSEIVHSAFTAIYWGIAICAPLLAAGTILEEKRTKTLAFLLQKPLTVWQLVFGKLMAIQTVFFMFLILTLLHCAGIFSQTAEGVVYAFWVYFFLFLTGVAYVAISMAVASFSKLYWRSYLWSYLIIFSIHYGATFLGNLSFYGVHDVFNYIGLQSHFDYFLAGGVALSTFVYLFSLIFIGILLTTYKVSRDNS